MRVRCHDDSPCTPAIGSENVSLCSASFSIALRRCHAWNLACGPKGGSEAGLDGANSKKLVTLSGPLRTGAKRGESPAHGGRCGAVMAMMACKRHCAFPVRWSDACGHTHRETLVRRRKEQVRHKRLSTEHPWRGGHLVEENAHDVLCVSWYRPAARRRCCLPQVLPALEGRRASCRVSSTGRADASVLAVLTLSRSDQSRPYAGLMARDCSFPDVIELRLPLAQRKSGKPRHAARNH